MDERELGQRRLARHERKPTWLSKLRARFNLDRQIELRRNKLLTLIHYSHRQLEKAAHVEELVDAEWNARLDGFNRTKVQLQEEIELLQIEVASLKNQILESTAIISRHLIEINGIRALLAKFPEAVNYSHIQEELKLLDKAGLQGGVFESFVKPLPEARDVLDFQIEKIITEYMERLPSQSRHAFDPFTFVARALKNELVTAAATNPFLTKEGAKQRIEQVMLEQLSAVTKLLPKQVSTLSSFVFEVESLFLQRVEAELAARRTQVHPKGASQ